MKALPKILLVADRPSWAWAAMQEWIIKKLSDRYDFYTDFLQNHRKVPPEGFRAQLGYYRHKLKIGYYRSRLKNRRHVRKLSPDQEYDIVVYLGFYFPLYGSFDYRTRRIIKGIYTDAFPPAGILPSDANISMESFVEKYLSDADAVCCGSQLICQRYADFIRTCYHAKGANDPDLFKRTTPLERNDGRRFVVGWTGNPNRAFKGFYDFVIPAVEAAKQQRPGIELKTRFSGPLHTLPRFYDDVDVVLIASDADAGPSLFEEACGCQVPSISTPIGGPYELIEHGKNGLFVQRDVEHMAHALVYLYDHRDVLFSMACRIRGDWLRRVQNRPAMWIEMFDKVLQDGRCVPPR